MNQLYLDTSNSNLTIIITHKDEIIVKYNELAAQKQTELALKTVNELLTKVNMTLEDINQLIITVGPGSYTGVRVAITFAKTLKVLKPDLGIFCLNTLLLQAGLNKAISVLSGYNNKSYLAVFDHGKTVIAPQLVNAQAKEGIIKDLKGYQLIEDFNMVNSVNNFLSLQKYFTKIENIEQLQPLYIGDNFQSSD